MKQRGKLTQYIGHPLNQSASKQACSFPRSIRFPATSTCSPNKYYLSPERKKDHHKSRGPSIGSANRPNNFSGSPAPQPNRYIIPSQFDNKKASLQRHTFGVSREEIYSGKKGSAEPGPGSYQLPQLIGNKPFYMGQKSQRTQSLSSIPDATRYNINSDSVARLSTHRQDRRVRIRTEYYPKTAFAHYDNHVPGPGQYEVSQKSQHAWSKNTKTTFGVGQRVKTSKKKAVGPGSYNIFSEFGPLADY